MMWKAVLHRHWIDTVGGMIVALPLTILLCFIFYSRVPLEPMVSAPDKPDTRYAEAAPEVLQVLPLEERVEVMKALEHHWGLTVYASLLLVLFVWGTGIRSNNLKARHPSIYYNLTLPVSRTTLVLTRYLMSVTCSVLLMGLLFVSNTFVMWTNDLYVPVGQLFQASFIGVLILCAGIAVYTVVAMFDENIAALGIPFALVVYLVLASAFRQEVHFIFLPNGLWVPTLLLVVGLCLAGAVWIATKKDF